MLTFFGINDPQRDRKLSCFLLKNCKHLRNCLQHHCLCSLFEDPCLLRRNLRKCPSKHCHMVIADGGDHGNYCMIYDIGSIKQASHAGFQYH